MRGSGCPICSGKTAISGENDLLTLFPNLAAEWHAERNVTPDHVTPYSNKKVWWRCVLGHEWQAVIAARVVENSGCPYCTGRRVLAGFNDLATLFPKIATQWDDTLNGSLTPDMVTPGSLSASGGNAAKDTSGKRSSTPEPEKINAAVLFVLEKQGAMLNTICRKMIFECG